MAEELLVILGAQDKGARTQVNALNRELKFLDTYYNTVKKSSKVFEDSLDGLKTKLGTLEAKYEANRSKLAAYNKQLDSARDGVTKKKAELEKLTNAEEENKEAIAKVEKQLANYQKQMKEAENGIKLTEAQMENLTEEINKTNMAIKNFDIQKISKGFAEAGANLEKTGQSISSAGKMMNEAGNGLIALSAPLTAFAGYATKVGIDFEASMAKVQATSGASAEELKQLTEKAKEVGRETQWSSSQAADGLNYLAMAGWDTTKMIAGLTPIVNLATAAQEDLGTVSDIVSDALTAFGLSAEETGRFTDVLAAASSSANTNVAMMGETFKYAAPVAGALGFSIEDVAISAGLMANAGIKASNAGTALRTMFVNMGEEVTLTSEAFDEMSISTINQDGTMRNLLDIIVDLREGFSHMTESEKAMNAESVSGKIGMAGLLAVVNASETDFNNLSNAIYGSAGRTQEMADIMAATSRGQIYEFLSKLEALGLQIAEELLPHINDLLNVGMAIINWFSSLDAGTKKTIISMGLFATATGGALKIVGNFTDSLGKAVENTGKITKGLGKMIEKTSDAGKVASNAKEGVEKLAGVLGKGEKSAGLFGGALNILGGSALPLVIGGVAAAGAAIYTYKEYQDSMNSKVTTASEELSYLEKAFLNLTNSTVYSKEEIKSMNLVYADFNENISSSFQESVKNMTADIHDFNLNLRDINLDGVFDAKEFEALTKRIDEALKGATSAIETSGKLIQSGLKEAFALDNTIDENEQALLDWWASRTIKEVEEAKNLRKEIDDIEKKAFEEGRALSSDEIAAIQDRYARIKQIELEAQAANTYELEYAQNEFNNRIKTLDAEAAQELLQQRYSQYEEEKIAIKSKYDTLISQAMSGYESLSAEDKKNVDDTIARLETAKAEQLALNQSYWDDSYKYAVESNENLAGAINKFNGEILSASDKNYYDRFVQANNHYKDLNTITESGYTEMYNTATGKWEDLYVKINEKTGELQSIYNFNSKELAAMSREDAKTLEKEVNQWKTTEEGARLHMVAMSDAYLDTRNNIRLSSGDIIASLEEVVDENGNVERSILGLNGKPYDIKDNTDIVIKKLLRTRDENQALRNSIQDINNKRLDLKGNMEEVTKKLQDTKKEVENLNGKKAVISVDDGGTINSLGSRFQNMMNRITGGLSGLPKNEKGTNYFVGGLSYVNEKGWELIDTPGKTTYLGTDNVGDIAYLPRGTKVTNHLSSTKQMLDAVRNEVSRQLSRVNLAEDIYNRNSYSSRALSEGNAIAANTPVNNPNKKSGDITIIINASGQLSPHETAKQMRRTLIEMGYAT